MKKINKIIISLMLLILPTFVFAKGDVIINKSSLTIEEGSNTSFTITASNSAGKVTITSSDKSIATVNKSTEWVEKETITIKVNALKVGNTTIKVAIDAATFDEEVIKTTKTINVNVTAKKSSNANLNDLKIDGVTISGFSSSKTSYTYNTESNSVNITANVEDTKASLSGTGTKSLKYGANKFTIKVKAENGTTKTYTITVNKKDDRNSNNNLKALNVSVGNINFNKNTTIYNIEVENNVKEITINASCEDTKSNVTGTGTKTLKEGNNEFKIVVTAENEKIKTYTIKVNRKSNNVKPSNEEPEVIEKKKYTLRYDSESFKYCSNSYLKEVTLEEGNVWGDLCTPIRDGYEFTGWYTERENGELIKENTLVDKDLIVYGHFNKIQVSPKSNLVIFISVSILSFLLGFMLCYILLKNRIRNNY